MFFFFFRLDSKLDDGGRRLISQSLYRSVGTPEALTLVGDGVGVGDGDPEKQPEELPDEPKEQLEDAHEGVGEGADLPTGAGLPTGADETGTNIFLTVTLGVADFI